MAFSPQLNVKVGDYLIGVFDPYFPDYGTKQREEAKQLAGGVYIFKINYESREYPAHGCEFICALGNKGMPQTFKWCYDEHVKDAEFFPERYLKDYIEGKRFKTRQTSKGLKGYIE